MQKDKDNRRGLFNNFCVLRETVKLNKKTTGVSGLELSYVRINEVTQNCTENIWITL